MTTKDFARDVAKQIERRAARRKWMWRSVIAGIVVIAIVYLRCGRGWGLGGSGSGSGSGNGSGSGVATAPADARTSCTIHVATTGVTVDGKAATREQAVDACRGLLAHVDVDGNVREGDWLELREALDAAGGRHTP